MSLPSLLPWQQPNWDSLQHYISQQKIPQALLITGRKGVGKQQLAEQFSYALLCQNRQNTGFACGQCNSCLLIAAQTHPDFVTVTPDEPGKAIGIGQIRQVNSQLSLKPQYEQYRVLLIYPADQMNNASANAFLKCLEEPGERTVIILITDKPSKLLPTIKSRCQKLHIHTPSKQAVFSWLNQHNVSDNHEILYSLAQGAPFLAQQYANEQLLKIRSDCFNAWTSIAKQQSHPVLVAETWQKLPESSLLFWISSWLIDIIKCAYHANPDYLFNPDLSNTLKDLAKKLDLKRVYKLYDLLLTSRQLADTQINKLLMFEEILIEWAELNRSS